jgi:hypothetical protein
MIDGSLYWHMRVTPTDGSRISYTTFVDAESGDVYRADNTAAIVSFIESGGRDESVQNESDSSVSGPDGTQSAITVHIVDDGEIVDTVHVSDQQEVVVSAGNSTASTANTTG